MRAREGPLTLKRRGITVSNQEGKRAPRRGWTRFEIGTWTADEITQVWAIDEPGIIAQCDERQYDQAVIRRQG